ncbi:MULTISPECIES: I78 family peptidase inhibitor [unclassified Pseudomonas]|uniref:I78 family peptidase inhibitor n=1 Tax=Pseudomonas TaxID=286 RepID=UPI00087129D8|nr:MULTISPECIES: I78 family peptidase inhibitor [unclassified Pseudomonas]SCW64531.1 Peptidase inhibitor I78 family protein [Pseudomonas sp. NFACC56-3]SFK58826.1 Peptidase inhibitor I78 family protein [Pseudomonas sp. NFACC52]
MISKSLFLALPLLLGAIAQTHAACDESLVKSFVGKKADPATVDDAIKTANASTARTISPPFIVPKGVVPDRLTIFVNEDNEIKSLSCEKGITLQ